MYSNKIVYNSNINNNNNNNNKNKNMQYNVGYIAIKQLGL